MAIFNLVVALVTIVSTVLVSSTEGKSNREGKQIFVIPYGPSDSNPEQYYPHQQYEPNPYYYPSVMTRQGSLPAGEHNPRFFGLIAGGLQNLFNGFKLPGCPTCPTCPNQSCNCPAIPGPATLTIADNSACLAIATIAPACVRASVAPSGTLSVTTVTATAQGNSVTTIVPQAPNTKVRVTCPTIPAGVTVRTQNNNLVANTPVEEAGFATIITTSAATVGANAAVSCTWISIP